MPLDCYLKRKNYAKSIVRDTEFLSSREVLEGKARKLHELGVGKPPNREKEEIVMNTISGLL